MAVFILERKNSQLIPKSKSLVKFHSVFSRRLEYLNFFCCIFFRINLPYLLLFCFLLCIYIQCHPLHRISVIKTCKCWSHSSFLSIQFCTLISLFCYNLAATLITCSINFQNPELFETLDHVADNFMRIALEYGVGKENVSFLSPGKINVTYNWLVIISTLEQRYFHD